MPNDQEQSSVLANGVASANQIPLAIGVASAKKSRDRSPEFTHRDFKVLPVIGEMFGLPLDLLAVLLARHSPNYPDGWSRDLRLSRRATRDQIDRWQAAGLVRTERLLGETWVTLTGAGLRKVGLSYPEWGAPVSVLGHVRDVAVVRLVFEASPAATETSWVAERALFAERGTGLWHVPDGLLVPNAPDSERGCWGVEVERTLKTRKRYRDVFAKLRPDISGLIYFAPAAILDPLRIALHDVLQERRAERPIRVKIKVLPTLPAGPEDVAEATS